MKTDLLLLRLTLNLPQHIFHRPQKVGLLLPYLNDPLLQPGHLDKTLCQEMQFLPALLQSGSINQKRLRLCLISGFQSLPQEPGICLHVGKGRAHLMGDLRDQLLNLIPAFLRLLCPSPEHLLHPYQLMLDPAVQRLFPGSRRLQRLPVHDIL